MIVGVTGADGFVGRHLLAALTAAGHEVVAAQREAGAAPAAQPGVRWRPLALESPASVAAFGAEPVDAVVHLAAVASGREAREAPMEAWRINAGGTAVLAEALAANPRRPRLLLVSTGEVYGAGPARPRHEDDPLVPMSPYAASKVGAEVAAHETARRTGLRLVVARPFAHTGPGQTTTYVVPAFAARLREARREGRTEIVVGNLAPVRDLLDVRDVVEAYVRLLTAGEDGTTYNVARGEGMTLAAVFDALADCVGVAARPVADPALLRSADLPHLVGDARRLQAATGWAPRLSIHQTLQDLVDAQAD